MRKNVLEYLQDSVKSHREKVAVAAQDRELSFGDLEQYARCIGWSIHHRMGGIRKPIAVYLSKGAESLAAFLGVLWSGNAYVPLDVHSPQERIRSILEDLENPWVITSRVYEDVLVSAGAARENMIQLEDVLQGQIGADMSIVDKIVENLVDIDPAYIIYTSGSTGKPKGVIISHRSIIDYIDWAVDCFQISQEEIIGSQSPFYFDNSTLDIYLTLAAGAKLVIIPETYFAFPVRLMEYTAEQSINFIFWVPSAMISVANAKALDHADVSCIRKILFAGEVMPNKHLNYWRRKIPKALYANLYGPTEITVDCTYYIVNRTFEDDEPLPIGFPCRNTDVLILNKENRPIEPGEVGELCVRGSSLALGYWKDKDRSEAVFPQNPLNSYYFDRIYRTGDLVYLNNFGEIVFVGRQDSQIKHLGYRIELGEIENAVLSLEGIFNGCVLYNRDKNEITLFYNGKKDLSEGKIRKELLKLVPKYMLPTRFYRLNELPLNNNGKIDRQKLLRNWIEIQKSEESRE